MTLTLANVRRTAPAEAARKYRSTTETQSAAWEKDLKAAEEVTMQEAREVELNVVGLDRAAEMEETWEKGLANLATVKAGIGATVGKLERAREVINYLESTT